MDTIIFWMILDEASIPSELSWLSPAELDRCQSFRFDKRKQDWLSGRWAAKNLILSFLKTENSLSMRDISIDNHPAGDPFVLFREEILNGSLSISHREGKSAAAYTTIPDISIGIDLELIEEKSEGFIENYFTNGEAKTLLAYEGDHRTHLASLLWSAREAMLKAQQIGLRIDTRQIELQVPSVGSCVDWCPIEILHCPVDMQPMALYWKQIDPFLITMAIKHKDQGVQYSPDLIEQVFV